MGDTDTIILGPHSDMGDTDIIILEPHSIWVTPI